MKFGLHQGFFFLIHEEAGASHLLEMYLNFMNRADFSSHTLRSIFYSSILQKWVVALINPCYNHICVFIWSQILHRSGFILPERRQYFMPSSLQTCLCSWLEPALRVVGKRVFVFWGQRYTCARALVCPLAFWRKESSSPSMSVLFHRCLLSKQSRWSYARGTRHKEEKKKWKDEFATLRAVFFKNTFSFVVNFCISVSHQSFCSSSFSPSGLVW